MRWWACFSLHPPVLRRAQGQSPALPSARQHSATLAPCRLLGRGRDAIPFVMRMGSLSLPLSHSCLELLIKRSLKDYENAVIQEFPICRCNWTRQSQKSTTSPVPFSSGRWGPRLLVWQQHYISRHVIHDGFSAPICTNRMLVHVRRPDRAMPVNKHQGAVVVLSSFDWDALHGFSSVVLALIDTFWCVKAPSSWASSQSMASFFIDTTQMGAAVVFNIQLFIHSLK